MNNYDTNGKSFKCEWNQCLVLVVFICTVNT